jgi:hypothetical protein
MSPRTVAAAPYLSAGFKMLARQLRLSDDALECSSHERIVERHGNRDRRVSDPLLHDPVASALANRDESVPFENPANLVP